MFMQPEFTDLGFKISKDDIFSYKENIETIKNAKEPQDVS